MSWMAKAGAFLVLAGLLTLVFKLTTDYAIFEPIFPPVSAIIIGTAFLASAWYGYANR